MGLSELGEIAAIEPVTFDDVSGAVVAVDFHRRYEADVPTLEVGEEADTR